MRNLGEQWVEDGHMWKVVPNGLCDGCDFNLGCMRNGGVICRSGHCVTKQGHVKDLGPVNEEGCLAEERTGLFPTITKVNDGIWKASVYQNEGLIQIEIEVWATTKQGVIDAWNRRAM